MFPYPSGAGLHVGHPEGYTASDIMARYWRMCDYDVLHPMGWDAFGLPAEQHAINTGTHPEETTKQNIANFKRQLRSLGFSYDCTRMHIRVCTYAYAHTRMHMHAYAACAPSASRTIAQACMHICAGMHAAALPPHLS